MYGARRARPSSHPVGLVSSDAGSGRVDDGRDAYRKELLRVRVCRQRSEILPRLQTEFGCAESALLRQRRFDVVNVPRLAWARAATVAIGMVGLRQQAIGGYQVECFATPDGSGVYGEVCAEVESSAGGCSIAEPPVQDRPGDGCARELVHNLCCRA